MYLSVKVKFLIALFIALSWLSFSTYLSIPWADELAQYVGIVFSFTIIFLIALLPGFMNAFLLVAFLIDKRPPAKKITQWPGISVLVPILNEEKYIAATI